MVCLLLLAAGLLGSFAFARWEASWSNWFCLLRRFFFDCFCLLGAFLVSLVLLAEGLVGLLAFTCCWRVGLRVFCLLGGLLVCLLLLAPGLAGLLVLFAGGIACLISFACWGRLLWGLFARWLLLAGWLVGLLSC